MKYISTRGRVKEVSFEKTVFSGYAPDGGIFMPNTIPELSKAEIRSFKNLSYRDLAEEILHRFIDENQIPRKILKDILRKSWSNFKKNEVVEMINTEKVHIMELFHGPTLAFKDIAMTILGQMMQYFLEQNNKRVTVLVGTSGDTGSSAIQAVKGLSNINIIVLLPKERCSPIQALQMTSVHEKNVLVFEVEGSSDDLDKPIKACFADKKFTDENNLCSMNSINWVRIMVQTIHYFYAYFTVAKKDDEIVEIVVPNGAMGNITSGLIARRMGLPIKLIACTNENDIVARCINNGDLGIRGEVIMTPAPSMDISFPYNIERIIHLLANGNAETVSHLMEDFERTGKTRIPADLLRKMQGVFSASTAKNSSILSSIKEVYSKYDYIVCPHTATAIWHCLQNDSEHERVVLATASPVKFPEAIKDAGITPPTLEELEQLKCSKNYAQVMRSGENWLEILKKAVIDINENNKS